MYSLFIIFAVGLLICILASSIEDLTCDGIGSFFCGVGIVIMFFVSWFVPLIIGGCNTNLDYYDKETSTPIVSLRNDTLASGSVFLACGSFNEKPVYFYYTQNSDGGIEQKNIGTSDVVLYEDAPADTGYIKIVSTYAKFSDNQPYKHWGFLMGQSDTYAQKTVKQIHIPQGTLLRQFKVN